MQESRDEILEEIVELYRAVGRVVNSISRPVWLEVDLTMPQLKTLFALAYQGPASIGQVAEILGIQLPTASHLVDRLVRAGFAERTEDPSDRRRTLAQLSPAGQALVARLRQGRREQLLSCLTHLDLDDLVALRRGLRAVVLQFEASSASSSGQERVVRAESS